VLLPVTPPLGTQAYNICTTFGVHPGLPLIQQLYHNGDASFLVNTGTLVVPMTKAQYLDRSNPVPVPPSLFAHNIQVRCTQSVHAQDSVAEGILGRIVDMLVDMPVDASSLTSPEPEPEPEQTAPAPPTPPPPAPPFRTGAYSLAGIKKMLDGSRPPNVLDTNGAVRLNDYETLRHAIGNLTGGKLKSAFVETFATMTDASIQSMELLGIVLEGVTLQSTRWTDTNGDGNVNSQDNTGGFRCNSLCLQFQQIAKVIAARNQLQDERQVFFIERGGFDTHNSALETVQSRMEEINTALTAFVDELQLLNVWDDVAILSSSDFARTLDSNGAGTDHAWGGNYVLLGGKVRGGTMHGQYPESYLPTSSVHVGRGRLMPTTSWEAVWHGIIDWFGVPMSSVNRVLPNAANFPANQLLNKLDLFIP